MDGIVDEFVEAIKTAALKKTVDVSEETLRGLSSKESLALIGILTLTVLGIMVAREERNEAQPSPPQS